MRYRTKLVGITLAGLIGAGALAGAAMLDDKPAAPAAAAAAAATAGPTPEQMAEWAKLNAPGPQHAGLKKLVGKFAAETTFKMAPDAPEMTSKGEEENTMVFGDRFLQSAYSGDMMGQPFKGMALTGYDAAKKKYVSLWVDDQGTGMMYSESSEADAAGKKVTFTGEMPCPMNGMKMTPYRHVLTIADDDHYQMEMFMAGPDGKEMRGMMVKYSRAK